MPGLGTALIASLVGLLGLFLVAANTWWHPAIIVSLGLVCVAGPAVGLAILFSDLREDRDLQSLLPIIVVAVAIGVGGSALWFLAPARVLAISTFGEGASIEAALLEPIHDIQVAACRRSFVVEGGVQASLQAMLNKPKLAQDCLSASQGPRIGQVEYSIGAFWYSKLMSSTPPAPELACRYAQTMDTFKRRDQDHQTQRMMNCALNAANMKTRVCCAGVLKARALTGEALTSSLWSDPEQAIRHHIPGPLVGLSYGEKGTTKRLSMTQDILELPLSSLKDSSLSLACEGLVTDEEGEHARPYLEWLLDKKESKTCMTPVQIQESRNIAMQDVCDRLMSSKHDASAEARVCSVVLAEVKTEQLARLKRAQRNAKNIAAMANGIREGHDAQIAQRNTLNGMIGSFESMVQGQPQYGVQPYVEGQTLEGEKQRDARLLKEMEAKAGINFSTMTRGQAKDIVDSIGKVDIGQARAFAKSVKENGLSGTPTKEQIQAASAMTGKLQEGNQNTGLKATSSGATGSKGMKNVRGTQSTKQTKSTTNPTNQVGRTIRINP